MDIINTKLGKIGIKANTNGISNLILNVKSNKHQIDKSDDKNVQQLINLLRDYFQAQSVVFNVKCDIDNYPLFYQKVWNVVRKIPFGKTMTYSEVARKVDNPKAYRAVGQALKANPLPIIIPCHRVIRKNGSLGGFSAGLKWKKRLLELEGVFAKRLK
ncbi:MAG: MGMT family protein [candidate division WOR-3 bacterium]|nr:MGMT family protein [candidate division WOR-3 bacterium]